MQLLPFHGQICHAMVWIREWHFHGPMLTQCADVLSVIGTPILRLTCLAVREARIHRPL
jgi:hypothetical protein